MQPVILAACNSHRPSTPPTMVTSFSLCKYGYIIPKYSSRPSVERVMKTTSDPQMNEWL